MQTVVFSKIAQIHFVDGKQLKTVLKVKISIYEMNTKQVTLMVTKVFTPFRFLEQTSITLICPLVTNKETLIFSSL